MSDLIKRSISLSGHRTSIALESEFWAVLDAMAQERNLSFAALIGKLDASRPPERPLASALRVAALQQALQQASDNS
ncbi:ribbon-helix-helix domain-containing protein [Gluconobacter wancherniae]|uniref:Ribbon-helix-helix domain-containing protein n=1 Tax=Gluconobacter wancherniae NBRC 103581 TaxID=656744 RepID=A0A511B2E6_9PROT|nr:ribbon-helix-helix domain-containing protein [Gluconobacter wancherniae]MBF0854197.1 ribbon-helix-helix domain-containing protein [Gluconobacter wancherniae]GBD57254.1 aryl-sulfate sulfotransferase [Gluconobacter wancherniae NBRC 103581]GBR65459.1 hypothetical protein AA103581_1844 [Gluconobacter wancherniae NBRC 103581]GEK93972.1 hypothetical protein GWA01_17420 [Gluconobacter wancherniae NBRC 103581]